MRPVAMKIKGFTSFRDEQTIDFADLDLFALWGPTGSGKSSVLDAITYALFGQVERVGNRAGQLVSQGQTRMAVTLDFAVGDETFRVTRSTPSSGATRARLERLVGDDFESFGEHADQVKAVNEALKEVIGLDYEAFSRSVILPQGKFAEFLTGEAKNRRRILIELLGLELFKRMAQRANEISKEARISAEVKEGLLERDYAGVDQATVAAAKEAAEDAAALAKAAVKAETKMDALVARWDEEARRIDALGACAGEIGDLAGVFSEHHAELARVAESIVPLEAEVTAARAEAEAAAEALDEARASHEEITGRWGRLEDVVRLLEVARGASRAHRELVAAQRSHDDEVRKEAAAVDELAASQELLLKARAELEMSARELAEREAAHAKANDDDKVGALVEGLSPGDPCPVCERPLERLPAIASDVLESAKQSLSAARAARESMVKAVHSAEKDVALAESALATAREGVVRCAAETTSRRAELDRHLEQLAAVLDDDEVDEAERILSERIDALKASAAAAEATAARHAQVTQRLTERTRALEAAQSKVGESRAALAAISLKPALQRAASAQPGLSMPDPWPSSAPDDAPALGRLASSFAGALDALGRRLERSCEKAEAARSKLLDQARAVLPAAFDRDVDDLHELAAEVRDAARVSSERAVLAKKEAADVATRLAAAASLRDEIAAHHLERETYKTLGAELKEDNIIEYLQEEALQVLASAATRHLHDLSSGRYVLDFDGGDFVVVDAWNGDERRSVNTLSGGETFLASLSLALALAEQIQLLAVSERNKLDSLFLDEGFGTLDAETLEVVVAAIEQLGGGDRLVGVITHVPELAERLPVRLEVTKSPRGSVISRRVGDLVVHEV